jgi:lysophospholipase L1-like esterase
VLLAIAAVIVLSAAGYVIAHNGRPDDGVVFGGATALGGSSGPALSAGTEPTDVVTSTSSPSLSTSVVSSSAAAPASVAEPIVAFLGDDYTSGLGASAKDARFTSIVATALHVIERNFGVAGSGYESAGRTGNYLTRLPDIVAAHPDVVVVTGGRNDIDSDQTTVTDHITKLFARLHDRLPGTVLIAVAPFWGDSPARSELAPIASAVASAVRAAGGSYLDIADPLLGHPDWMANEADPNDAGYAAIAAAVEPGIAAHLPKG